jgi:hypothetical protein
MSIKTLTVSYDSKGVTSLLYGQEVTAKDQRKKVQEYKLKGLPKGVQRVEIWNRAEGIVKKCVRPPVAVKAKKEDK